MIPAPHINPPNKQLDLSGFHCIRCHACCRQPGYVRLKPGEAETIAGYLGMDILEFTSRFTILTKDRQALSLIEKENGACLFLDEKGCKINDVKPQQCLDFPHKWRFSDFETICGWAKKWIGDRKPETEDRQASPTIRAAYPHHMNREGKSPQAESGSPSIR